MYGNEIEWFVTNLVNHFTVALVGCVPSVLCSLHILAQLLSGLVQEVEQHIVENIVYVAQVSHIIDLEILFLLLYDGINRLMLLIT